MNCLLLFLIIIVAVNANLSAQITINSSNWKSSVGVDTIAMINPIDFNIDGWGYKDWDEFFYLGEQTSLSFTALQSNYFFLEKYLPTSNNTFPNADYYIDSLFDVLAYNRGVYRNDFYKKDEDGLYVLGYEYEKQSYFIGDLTGSGDDSIKIENYSNVYNEPLQLYKFPITSGYSHEFSFLNELNTKITVAAFILNNTPVSKKSYIAFKDTVIGFTEFDYILDDIQGPTKDVLIIKRVVTIVDSIFLNEQPAPPSFLAAFSLEQGAISNVYRTLILAENMSSPLMIITWTDGTIKTASTVRLNLTGYSDLTHVVDDNVFSSCLSIYPNPSSDFINVNFINKENPTSIQIINSLGYSVYQMDASQIVSGTNRIDVSNLASGVYFIKIGDKVSKFVKY